MTQKGEAFHPIKGQTVSPVKVQRARELRHEMTGAERILWHELRHLRHQGLIGLIFRRQQVIAGLIVDFYCYAAKLVVEVDGTIHAGQLDYDLARDEVLAAHGLRILRVTNNDVLLNFTSVLDGVIKACRED